MSRNLRGGNFFASIINGRAMQPAVDVNRGSEWMFVALTYDKKLLSLYVDEEVVAETKVGKPDLTHDADGGAIRLASWKDPGWNFKDVIDEEGVFNEELSADTLKDFLPKALNKPCLFLPSLNSRLHGESSNRW